MKDEEEEIDSPFLFTQMTQFSRQNEYITEAGCHLKRVVHTSSILDKHTQTVCEGDRDKLDGLHDKCILSIFLGIVIWVRAG